MNQSFKAQIMKSIAATHGITPEEVEAEIKAAIAAGMESDDPAVKKTWRAICPDSQMPIVDTVLAYLLGRCLAKMVTDSQ